MNKPWYRSRMIWLNIIVAGMGSLLGTGVLPAWAMALVTVLVAMGNVILRYDTDQGVE